jgi:hypothetical protein
MKRALVLLTVVALTASLYADPFVDFRIPTHQVYNVTGSFSGNFVSRHVNQGTYEQNLRTLNGGFTGSGYWLYDSDALRGQAQLSASSSGRTSRYRSFYENNPQDLGRYDTDEKDLFEGWSFYGDTRLYPWTVPIGFSGNLSAAGSYGQDWGSAHRNNVSGFYSSTELSNGSEWRYYYDASAGAGLGFGRVRNATVVFVVHVMEDRLLKSGALTRELSSASREKLAELLYAQKPYSSIHGRPAKYFWKEVEKILRDDGALRPEGLEAYDLYRIIEPSFGNGVPRGTGYLYGDGSIDPSFTTGRYGGGFLRQRGFFVGANASITHYHDTFRRSTRQHYIRMDTTTVVQDTVTNYYTHENVWSDFLSVGPKAEVHYPWGMRWQFDAVSSVMFPVNNLVHAFVLDNLAQAQYLITDRWYGSAYVHHRRELQEHKYSYGYRSRADDWSVDVGADLAYYVEDRTSISLSFGMTQWGSTPNPEYYSTNDHLFWRDTHVALGISYHFLGRFNAPNLGVQSGLPPAVWPWER